jgi:2-hydroxy-3-oxopropionate reductase
MICYFSTCLHGNPRANRQTVTPASPGGPQSVIKPGATVIGFIGLGVMGSRMARRLVDAGFELHVFNRTPSKAQHLVRAGAVLEPSPSALAAVADVVITMVTDGPDVRAVTTGQGGILEGAWPGMIWIDMSTISVDVSRELGEAGARADVTCLDAPVSGGPGGAESGTLLIMVGGEEKAYERCLPLLQILGSTISHMGELGAGQIAKACNQVMVAANMAGVAEALVLGAKAGVDPVTIRKVLLGGFAQSRILEVHGERMLEHRFEPGFFARLHRKDLQIVMDMARPSGAAVPQSAIVAQLLDTLIAQGDGELDNSAMVKFYEAAAMTELGSAPSA